MVLSWIAKSQGGLSGTEKHLGECWLINFPGGKEIDLTILRNPLTLNYQISRRQGGPFLLFQAVYLFKSQPCVTVEREQGAPWRLVQCTSLCGLRIETANWIDDLV